MNNSTKKHLFEDAPVLTAILRLAIPSVISQLILVIYNLADTFFIGLAGKNSYFASNNLTNALIGGVTICMPVFMIISALSNLFGIGAGSVMSRSIGKKNYQRAKNASGFSIYGCLISLVLYCLLCLIIIKPLTSFLSGNDEIVASYARTYILVTVVICGIPTGLNTLFAHLLRAEGRSFIASFGIALGGVLNVVLDPLFMFVLFDIKDAALAAAFATGLSNVIALIFYIVYYFFIKKDTYISIKPSTQYFKENVPSEVLTVGLPACLMTLCENISYMILDNCIATISIDETIKQAALAGVGASKKINMFAHSIARGMTQGVLPLIGYNKSSGRRTRMKKIINASMGITTGVATLCLIINIFFARQLSSLFLSDSLALDYSSKFLIIFSCGAPFSAIAYSIISFFQAVGKAWRSLILALMRKGILDIPLMFILPLISPLSDGVGTVMATPLADVVCCITAIIIFLGYLKSTQKKTK